MSASKAIIFAPFWRQRGHVGNYRIDRFIRWLRERGDEVVVVRAGDRYGLAVESWGTEFTIRDPLGFHPDHSTVDAARAGPVRRPNRLRRYLANLLFNPDPAVVWAVRAASDKSVQRIAQGARWIISSSPRESSHVAAAKLSRRVGAALIIDMRDGWLDEPLDLLLQNSRLSRRREGRLEARILRQAHCIFVTSRQWREMLQARLPFVREKTVVLTNAYPRTRTKPCPAEAAKGPLTLLHAGRLRGSDQSRLAELLFAPLLEGLRSTGEPAGVLVFLGDLTPEDRLELTGYRARFEDLGWRIQVDASVSREEMIVRLSTAHGLLLLSASQAAIPSKVFEYIPTGKPVLAVCPKGSAVWDIAADLKQFFPVDSGSSATASSTVRSFLQRCRLGGTEFEVPEQYSEPYLKEIFLGHLLA